MAGPWEKYQAAPAEQPAQQTGPWSKYAAAPPEQAQAPAAPEGEVGWLTPVDDAMRVAADSMSRGYLDKLLGDEAQQHTARSRERLSGWVETPVDIASAVVSSPYRIGSMGVGALAGAAEGAASAYGHQDDWVPDSGETMDILKNAAIGAVGGAGGAKLGEWVGGTKLGQRIGGNEAEAAKPYNAANVDKINAAKGTPRDNLAKLMSDLENASPEVQAKVAEIAGAKSGIRKAGAIADKTGRKLPPLPMLALEMATGHGIPWKTLSGMAVKEGVSRAGKAAAKVSDKEIDVLAELERNGPLDIDPAVIDQWRDALAKASIGYGREP